MHIPVIDPGTSAVMLDLLRIPSMRRRRRTERTRAR